MRTFNDNNRPSSTTSRPPTVINLTLKITFNLYGKAGRISVSSSLSKQPTNTHRSGREKRDVEKKKKKCSKRNGGPWSRVFFASEWNRRNEIFLHRAALAPELRQRVERIASWSAVALNPPGGVRFAGSATIADSRARKKMAKRQVSERKKKYESRIELCEWNFRVQQTAKQKKKRAQKESDQRREISRSWSRESFFRGA